jgi:hypothetical protein
MCDCCGASLEKRCYPGGMSRLLRPAVLLLFVVTLSACGLVTPPTLEAPPPLCDIGQESTETDPCTARPVNTNTSSDSTNPATDSSGVPTDTPPPSDNGDTSSPPPSDNQPTPTASCSTAPTSVSAMPKLVSQTTLKSCYFPGASDSVYVSLQLQDDSVTFTEPTIVFDIVRTNANGSTTSVAYSLLAGIPSANPDVFRGMITKDMLLAGLETAVSLKFKSTAPAGNYTMVISLFVNDNAYDPANLVGRVFYPFEIKPSLIINFS